MRHPTLILLRLSAVLSVNYLICRRIRCCLPKPAEIEINAPGALVVISVGRASCARLVKHSSLWNLSSDERDFFFSFFFLSLHQIFLVHTPNVWIARTKEGQQLSKAVLWECCDWWRLKTNSTPKNVHIRSFPLILICCVVWYGQLWAFPCLLVLRFLQHEGFIVGGVCVCVCILAPPAHKSF